MVAIQTKYLGPTNNRGSRIKAFTETKITLTVYWDHSLNVEQNHREAAMALAKKMEWSGHWVGGGTDNGYSYVNADRDGDACFTIGRKKEN